MIRKHRRRQSAVATDTHASYPPPPFHPASYFPVDPCTCHRHLYTYYTATVLASLVIEAVVHLRRFSAPPNLSCVRRHMIDSFYDVCVPVFLPSLYIIIIIIDVCMCNSGGRATGLNHVIYNIVLCVSVMYIYIYIP